MNLKLVKFTSHKQIKRGLLAPSFFKQLSF